jgi:hypothetical protein
MATANVMGYRQCKTQREIRIKASHDEKRATGH